MTVRMFVSLVAGALALGATTAEADRRADRVHDASTLVASRGAPVRPVSDFGFYYRDRDGFFFGYDARDGRRWYRDWRRQYYYERYYDHRKRRWLRDRRHYHDWYRRHHRDRHYRDRDYRHWDHYYRDGRSRGRGHGHRHRHDDRHRERDRRGRH